MTRRLSIILSCAGLVPILLIMSCEQVSPVNGTPEILDMTVWPDTIPPESYALITCEALDPDGDYLGYAWYAGDGQLIGRRDTIIFKSHHLQGPVTIYCTVGDPDQNMVQDSVLIEILDIPDDRPDLVFNINGRNHCLDLRAPEVIHVDLEESAYECLPTQHTAHVSQQRAFSTILASTRTNTLYSLPLNESSQLAYTQYDGITVYFIDFGDRNDNHGSVSLALVGSQNSHTETIIADARQNCIEVSSEQCAGLTLPEGGYIAFIESAVARYGTSGYFSSVYMYDEDSTIYCLDRNAVLNMEREAGDSLFAFFAERGTLDDNGGNMLLRFLPLWYYLPPEPPSDSEVL